MSDLISTNEYRDCIISIKQRVQASQNKAASAEDGPTIGILICKSKSDNTVEYSPSSRNKPISMSEYQIIENLPDQLKSSLPSIEQIETNFFFHC